MHTILNTILHPLSWIKNATRDPNDFFLPLPRTETYKKSTYYALPAAWNLYRHTSNINQTNWPLKVHKHEIYFFDFFAATETLWFQGPVTRDFWKSCSIRPRLLNLSSYAQPAMMKCVPRMLSQRWNSFRVFAHHILNDVFVLDIELCFFPCPLLASPCLTPFVSCLKCLFLVSYPLFPFSRLCSLSPALCSMS